MTEVTARASTVTPIVERSMAANRPIFLWGAPGIGKSELVAGITDALPGNNLMIDFNNSQYSWDLEHDSTTNVLMLTGK